MKKLIVIVLVVINSLNAKAQKLIEYAASNGITYHLKDTVHLLKIQYKLAK
jgi:hypothetical protein